VKNEQKLQYHHKKNIFFLLDDSKKPRFSHIWLKKYNFYLNKYIEKNCLKI